MQQYILEPPFFGNDPMRPWAVLNEPSVLENDPLEIEHSCDVEGCPLIHDMAEA